MSDEIKLTLNPTLEEPQAATAAAFETAQQQAEEKVEKDVQSSQTFTPEEQKMIDDFSRQINILDTNLVFSYGAAAQQGISQFSDSALKNVQTHDLDKVGDMIGDLVVELRTGKESELVQAISALEGVQNVSLVSHDGEIRS